MYVIAAFYRFIPINDCSDLKAKLQEICLSNSIQGTAIIAHEGINGTVAGTRAAIDLLINFFFENGLLPMEYKESFATEIPFKKLKIKIKPEIVTLGTHDVDVSSMAGTYVQALEWNRLIMDPEVVVLDVRNDFEVELGTFKNAMNPKTKVFSDFPTFVKEHLSSMTHKKIAMSCTGGIRCEKASAYMKQVGFKDVFHLKGGILQYLQDVPLDQSLWQGECFVFDTRVAVDHQLCPLTDRPFDSD